MAPQHTAAHDRRAGLTRTEEGESNNSETENARRNDGPAGTRFELRADRGASISPVKTKRPSFLTFYEIRHSMNVGSSFAQTEKGKTVLALQLPSTKQAEQEDGKVRNWILSLCRIRPGALGLVALALSILVWSSASKLSRYHVHTDPSIRTASAKLWLDTRASRSLTDVLRKVATIEPPPVALNLSATVPHMIQVDLGPVEQVPSRLPSLAPIVSLLPSRAPPMRRFCLA